MKRVMVMKYDPERPTGKWKTKKNVMTAQLAEDILILDYFVRKEKQEWTARHCLNVKTNEYETYFPQSETWKKVNLPGVYDAHHYCGTYEMKRNVEIKPEYEHLIKTALSADSQNIFRAIEYREEARGSELRERNQIRKEERINALMDSVPPLPPDINSWIRKVTGQQNYAFYDKNSGTWKKTCCAAEGEPFRPEGGKIRHNDRVICPVCRAELTAKKRVNKIEESFRFMLLQKVDGEKSISRHFKVTMGWEGRDSWADIHEEVRLVMYHGKETQCRIYYAVDGCLWLAGHPREIDWWDSNPGNKHMRTCCLYPEGIEEALKNTGFDEWGRLLTQMAVKGVELDYNRLMEAGTCMIPVTEYLFKGRFWRLLKETAQRISMYGRYFGELNLYGKDEREVFGINDRQKILRIRQINGGEEHIKWMRYSEQTDMKISQDTLEWLIRNKIIPSSLKSVDSRMTPQQVMNYIIRQKETQYRAMAPAEVLDQWNDYLSMCRAAGKNLADEMVYRPKELKRRHDEILVYEQKAKILQDMERNPEEKRKYADEMAAKFPGAEENLKAAKPKYEYRNEEYLILVPDRLVEIVREGSALHHCASASERYFERLMSKETCICFLRRTEEPDIPFYTIEVEPNGTIRQHRSYLDEEPGIEEIREFLREWQQVIRKRIGREDMELQKISTKKREKNMQELIAKNNARVIQGLLEDFMEVV